MKQLSALSVILLFLFVTVSALLDTQSASGVTVNEQQKLEVAQDDPAGEDEAIEKAMEAMKSAGRSIRRALRKKDIDTALAVVNRAQIAVIEAKKLVPAAAKKLQAEARSDMERDFRQRLIAVLDRWILVEKALLQGKTEDASNFIISISELKKSGHKEYEVED